MIDDRLSKMFQVQKEQDKLWIDYDKFRSDDEYKMKVVKQRVLDISDQLMKLLNLFPWKDKVKNEGVIENDKNILEQIIDIQKYLFGFANLLKYNPDEFFNEFVSKSELVGIRFSQIKNKIAKDAIVVIFDLDNVICDYSTTYNSYIANKLDKDIEKLDMNLPINERFGINKNEEEQLNVDFTNDGMFLECKPYGPAVKGLFKLRKECPKLKVIIATARPCWKFSFLVSQTYQWLLDNGIHNDLVLFNKDKADAVLENFNPTKVVTFVEDRSKHAIEVANLDIPVLLLDKPYNKDIDINAVEKIYRVYSWNNIIEKIISRYFLVYRVDEEL